MSKKSWHLPITKTEKLEPQSTRSKWLMLLVLAVMLVGGLAIFINETRTVSIESSVTQRK